MCNVRKESVALTVLTKKVELKFGKAIKISCIFQKEHVGGVCLWLGRSAAELTFLPVWEAGSQLWNTLERSAVTSGLSLSSLLAFDHDFLE